MRNKTNCSAGEKCVEVGYTELGNFLVHHSKEERNHHKLFIRDCEKLVEKWNAENPDKVLNANEILDSTPAPGTISYIFSLGNKVYI